GTFGPLVEQVAVADPLEAARVAGVAVGDLLLPLLAGQCDLRGVDDDHEVAGVDVRGIDRLVLAAEKASGLGGEAAEHDVSRVDDVPLAPDLARLRLVRAHVNAASALARR